MSAQWWDGLERGREPRRPLLVVVVQDDPETVSVLPSDYGSRWLERTRAADTPTGRLAEHLQVPVHHASGPEIPDGHDLLLLVDAGRGLTTAAATIACTHLQAEPQLAVGHGSGIDDLQWMDKVIDVRDRARRPAAVPEAIEILIGVLEQAAHADIPVLLDGVVSAAAAALSTELPPTQCPVVGDEPAQRLFLDRTDVGVWAGMGIGPGAGLGALSGLAMLQLGLLAKGD